MRADRTTISRRCGSSSPGATARRADRPENRHPIDAEGDGTEFRRIEARLPEFSPSLTTVDVNVLFTLSSHYRRSGRSVRCSLRGSAMDPRPRSTSENDDDDTDDQQDQIATGIPSLDEPDQTSRPGGSTTFRDTLDNDEKQG